MIKFDCHVHTVASGHAFGTIEEIAGYCRRKGLEGFVLTDHGPAIPGSANDLYFSAIKLVPRELDGVQLLRGVEANIMDYNGSLDLPDRALRQLDVVIASFHDVIIESSTIENHTKALLSLAHNPLVDILGHTGRGPYRFDIPTVLQACKDTGTLVEVNQWTLKGDPNNQACMEIAKACKALQVPIVINSDAHTADAVGRVDLSLELLQSIDFPEDLIMNRTAKVFKTHIKQKKPWLDFEI
ncbi:MAG: phosphatase [Eubacteriales bacterium]|nr:phosphatase [Eubacteriales bacterium]